jgi:hypothetical protein
MWIGHTPAIHPEAQSVIRALDDAISDHALGQGCKPMRTPILQGVQRARCVTREDNRFVEEPP